MSFRAGLFSVEVVTPGQPKASDYVLTPSKARHEVRPRDGDGDATDKVSMARTLAKDRILAAGLSGRRAGLPFYMVVYGSGSERTMYSTGFEERRPV